MSTHPNVGECDLLTTPLSSTCSSSSYVQLPAVCFWNLASFAIVVLWPLASRLPRRHRCLNPLQSKNKTQYFLVPSSLELLKLKVLKLEIFIAQVQTQVL